MKFEAKIENKILRPWLKSTFSVVDEFVLSICKTGFRMVAVDPANVCMVRASLSDKLFNSYNPELDTDGAIKIGLDTQLRDVVINSPLRSVIQLKLERGGENDDIMLVAKVDKITYTIRTLLPDSIRKESKVPKLDLPLCASVPLNFLCDIVKAVEKAGHDYIAFKYLNNMDITDPSRLILSTSDEWGKRKVESELLLDEMGPSIVRQTATQGNACDPSFHTLVSMDYLVDIMKGFRSFDQKGLKDNYVKINLGTDYPMIFDFAKHGLNIKYLLAPRIESN